MRVVLAWLALALIGISFASPVAAASGSADAGDEPLISPLPDRVIDSRLYVTGISRSNQILRIYREGTLEVETRSNESGDFAAAIVLEAGRNAIQVVAMDFGRETEHSQTAQVEFAPWSRAKREESPAASAPTQADSLLAPVLDQPASPATSNPITVTGTATAGVTIKLFVNSRLANSGIVAGDGHFSVHVPLVDGANAIYGVAEDSSGQSPASNTVNTSYTNQLSRTLTGTISQDTTWTAGDGTPYSVTGNLTVPAGVTLWVQAGAALKFSASYKLLIQGTLVIWGSAGQPVSITSGRATPARNDWQGIEIATTATAVSIDYAQIEYSGNAVYFNGGTGTVTHSLIRNSVRGIYVAAPLAAPTITSGNEITANQYGIYVQGNNNAAQNPLPVVTGNSLYANTSSDYYAVANFGNPGSTVLNATGNWWGTTDAVLIATHINDWSDNPAAAIVDYSGYLGAAGGTPVFSGPTLNGPISTNTTLTATQYQVLGTVEVAAGVVLSIPAGTTLSFMNNYTLRIKGTLQVQGSSTQRVVFTSGRATPARGDWAGIEITATATGVSIDYAQIEYANNGVYFNGSSGTLSNSLIRNNSKGVYVFAPSAAPTIGGGNEITANQYGVYVQGNSNAAQNPAPTVSGNSLYANTTNDYAAVSFGNAATTTLTATGNWWGTIDPAVIAVHVYDHTDSSTAPLVNYWNYLDGPGGQFAVVIYNVTISQFEAKPLQSVTAAGSFSLSTAASVVVQIHRESDDAIVSARAQSYPTYGTYSFSWDGRDDSGNAQPSGLYRVVLVGSSGSSNFTYDAPQPTTAVGMSNTTLPTIFSPYKNQFWKVGATMSGPALLDVSITPVGGTAFALLHHGFFPMGSNWIYWDGRDPSGQILAQASDIVSSVPVVPRPTALLVSGTQPTIAGNGAVPDIEVKSNPYLVSHSYEEASTITYRISLDAYVTVKMLPPGIYDPSDPSAIVLTDNVLQQANDGSGQPLDHSVEWRGYNPSDPNMALTGAEGVFTFTIEARSQQTQLSTLYRGALQIRR